MTPVGYVKINAGVRGSVNYKDYVHITKRRQKAKLFIDLLDFICNPMLGSMREDEQWNTEARLVYVVTWKLAWATDK